MRYWLDQKLMSTEDKIEGVIFSILNIFDGGSLIFPKTKIIPSPHPTDKEFHIENGSNYFPENVDINADFGELHSSWLHFVKKMEEKSEK